MFKSINFCTIQEVVSGHSVRAVKSSRTGIGIYFFFAGVGVERNDFSDPQGGKGICDRQAATIKGDIGRYVNEGNDVTTAIQLKTAIESGPGSCAKASYVTFNPSSTRHVKWDGVSLLNNFKYEENGINVGPGKLLPWSQFEGVLQVPATLEVVDPPSQKLSTKPSFKKVRHRHCEHFSGALSSYTLSIFLHFTQIPLEKT